MRMIAHLDMDAFFAAIEERDNPRFRNKPIVVGADPRGGKGRGVVSTANYKARVYGIHSAMPISEAWRLSEGAKNRGESAAIFLGCNFKKYIEVSEKIIAIIRKCVPLVEEASIDEAYFDLSFCGSFNKAEKLCLELKKEIFESEKLTSSIGLGPNKLIAKIASDMKKPDGLTVVVTEDAEKFLEPMPVRKIPGIGPKTEIMLNNLGVRLVKDLKKLSRGKLKEMLGKWGEELYEKAHGLDDSPIIEEYETKSIGEQETFSKDTRDMNFINERLKVLCESVIQRFKKSDFETFQTVAITVRFSDFETKTRARTLSAPAADAKTLFFEATRLLLPFLDKRDNPKQKFIRLIGVRIEKLE